MRRERANIRGIRDLALLCKSTHAGPFIVTIDVLLEGHRRYPSVKASSLLNMALVARLYGMAANDVLCTPHDTAAASKASMPCPTAAGAFGDTEVDRARQHAHFLDMDIQMKDLT